MKSVLLIWMICLGVLQADAVPSPGAKQTKSILLRGGVIHVGNGQVYENGWLAFSGGEIEHVSNSKKLPNLKDWRIIDVQGKHIYPGLIAPTTQLGLKEISSLRPTLDHTEIGQFKPHIRTLTSYNTDSVITPTVRANGILIAEIMPKGGIIAGTSSLVQLDAWNWEDAVISADSGLHIYWIGTPIETGQRDQKEVDKTKKGFLEQIEKLRTYLKEAKAYLNDKNPKKKNLGFEAMRKVFSGEKKVFIHCNFVRDMLSALAFLKEFELKGAIVGGRDAWMITKQLKEQNVAVVYQGIMYAPIYQDDDMFINYKVPSILQKEGVEYCLTMYGTSNQRNLPFEAGNAVRYGLTKEQAISAITLNTAKIFGIADRVGSLEVGKDATLIVSTGDILDTKSSHVELAFIEGREVDLSHKQKDLYEKFGEKLGIEVK